ncbi:MAG: tetratricopeptide repeat protein [Verrucomicrobiota bacterium]|nr:tetratricopeptide repeat protein [Verrucomicrobiota bacterium]
MSPSSNHACLACLCMLAFLLPDGARLLAAEQETTASIPTGMPQLDPQSAFQAAVLMFDDGFHRQAENAFKDWLDTNQSHDMRPLVAEYALWAGAEYASVVRDYSQSSDLFSQLLRNYPESSRRQEFAFGEAWSRFHLRQFTRVSELLADPNAPFLKESIRTETSGDPRATTLRLKGQLLLAETYLKMEAFDQTKAVLDTIPDWSLSDELVWRREFLLTQLLLSEGDLEEARHSASRLLAWARSIDSVDWIAESVSLKGDVLQANGQFDAAMETYSENLDTFIPEARRREARLKIIELNLLNEKVETVIGFLSTMVQQGTNDASMDVVLLTLGELHLKQYFGLASRQDPGKGSSPGDLLVKGRRSLEALLEEYPLSVYRGRTHYTLGWCLWELGEYPQSMVSFQLAAEGLDKSIEHAESLFKWGDILLRSGDAKGALKQYGYLFSEYQNYEQVRASLYDQMLYQMLRAAVMANDLKEAKRAAEQIMLLYPHGPLVQRSRLLLGQRLVHVEQIAEARSVFEEMIQQFGDFPLRAEVDLAVAHTFEQEGAWHLALDAHESWLETYPEHPSRPRVAYARAWVTDRLGDSIKALQQFQQFAKSHSSHNLLPLAKNWIADHFYNLGRFEEAEREYAAVASELPQSSALQQSEARLMMAKCRFRMTDYAQVIEHLKPLTEGLANTEAVDRDFIGEVFLCRGDAYFELAMASNPPSQPSIDGAISSYLKVYAVHMPNRWESRAWGRYGDLYHFTGDDYPEALKAYERALTYQGVSISMRSQLLVSIGQVREHMAEALQGPQKTSLLEEALEHYLAVVYMKNLQKGETPDAFWIREAGVRAMQVLEHTRNWPQAKVFSAYLSELLPSQGDEWLQMMNRWTNQLPLDRSFSP